MLAQGHGLEILPAQCPCRYLAAILHMNLTSRTEPVSP